MLTVDKVGSFESHKESGWFDKCQQKRPSASPKMQEGITDSYVQGRGVSLLDGFVRRLVWRPSLPEESAALGGVGCVSSE